MESHSPPEDLIQFHVFDTREEQASWLAREIEKNVRQDELSCDDIVVINPNPLTTTREVGLPRQYLFKAGINTHLAGVDTSPDIFFDTASDSIAFTGIFRAKGNEAGMVYVINAQDCVESFGSLARLRNQLFTAITRSKAWVRVLGVGKPMRALCKEFEAIKSSDFTLHFRYPTEEQRKHIAIINRDMTREEARAVAGASTGLKSILDDVEAGRVLLEDLPQDQIRRLRKLFKAGGGADEAN